MTLELENDSSRDFLDAVLGLRSVLAQLRIASEAQEAASLSEEDPAVLLLLGLHSVEQSLKGWVDSLEDPVTEENKPERPSETERFLR